jgi:AcrR family transcriptional regulator
MKSPRLDASPRKFPTQDRAKATVAAILAATSQVLIAVGYERATTARVADRAGVSIGTLYQYFPNKEALVVALIENHADDLVAIVREVLQRHSRATLAECVRASIDATMAAHRMDPRLHKILHEQVPRVGQLGRAMHASADIMREVVSSLRAHADELDPSLDLVVAATVVSTVLDAIAHKAVLDRDTVLTGKTAADEGYALVMGYLTRSPAR